MRKRRGIHRTGGGHPKIEPGAYVLVHGPFRLCTLTQRDAIWALPQHAKDAIDDSLNDIGDAFEALLTLRLGVSIEVLYSWMGSLMLQGINMVAARESFQRWRRTTCGWLRRSIDSTPMRATPTTTSASKVIQRQVLNTADSNLRICGLVPIKRSRRAEMIGATTSPWGGPGRGQCPM
jgi:hypothetical protein